MRFWDSSAVIPLLFHEAASPALRKLLASDRQMHVWWGTELECVSAIARREREGLDISNVTLALERLSQFRQDWSEVLPTAAVREMARRILRVHPLRTADSLQLAAASVLAREGGFSVELVTLDDRLRLAASREGFSVSPSNSM